MKNNIVVFRVYLYKIRMTSKNSSQFLSNDNLSVLFEVITDEYKNYILDKNAFNIAFNEMVQMFYYNQIKSGNQTIHDIITMNKNFISFISIRLEKKFNIQKQVKPNINSNMKLNTYANNTKNNSNSNSNNSNNVNNLPITSEDIKNKRLENFDKELSLKQNEFKNAFNSNIPETPNFTSPVDEPISEIDVLTKQKLTERENEIQSIYNNNNSVNGGGINKEKKELDFEIKGANEWLQYFSSPVEKKETNISNIMKSIKIKEEIPKEYFVKEENVLQHNRYGDSSNTIPKKNISWSDEKGLRQDTNYIKIKILEDQNENKDRIENNLFSKLKKIEGGDQSEIDVLTPVPAKVVSSGSVSNETITRMENKIDKLSSEINKCYDVITLLFNTIMSSNNVSLSSGLTPHTQPNNMTTNTDIESNTTISE